MSSDMKRPVIFILALLSAIPSFAQSLTAQFDFSVALEGDTAIKAKGSALLQDDSYHIDTPVLEVWCDGETRWVIDKEGKEVVIEMAEPVEDILELAKIDWSDDVPESVSYEMEDGTVLNISIRNFKRTNPVNQLFRFDISRLSKEYVVTDLR